MGLKAFFVYLIFLVAIPVIIAVYFPMDSTTVGAAVLFSPALTVGALLISVVGILLGIFDSRNLKATQAGKSLRALVYMLCGALFGSFFVGVASMWILSNPGSPLLSDALAYIFVASVFTATVGVVAATVKIVG